MLINQADPKSGLDLVKNYKLNVPVISDPEMVLSKAYKVRATPFAYRLDVDGIVRRRGIVNNQEGLEELLKEPASSEVEIELPQPSKDA